MALPVCVLDCGSVFSLCSFDIFILTFGEGDLELTLNWEEKHVIK